MILYSHRAPDEWFRMLVDALEDQNYIDFILAGNYPDAGVHSFRLWRRKTSRYFYGKIRSQPTGAVLEGDFQLSMEEKLIMGLYVIGNGFFVVLFTVMCFSSIFAGQVSWRDLGLPLFFIGLPLFGLMMPFMSHHWWGKQAEEAIEDFLRKVMVEQ